MELNDMYPPVFIMGRGAIDSGGCVPTSNTPIFTLEMKGMTKWHRRFIQVAEQVSQWSKDRSTKVGAVVVKDWRIQTTGFNGFPVGIDDNIDSRHIRPTKYLYTEHAERNAVFQAARDGVSLRGCTLYMNFDPIPCCDCVRAIIQAGIVQIVGPDKPFAGKGLLWETHNHHALILLREAGITVLKVPMEDIHANP